jgi:uncharacterized membrane protein
MKKNLSKEYLDNMSKDPSNWKGPFYFNKKDPRVIVPKLHPSMGWTLNFASPYSVMAMIALLAIIAASVIIG